MSVDHDRLRAELGEIEAGVHVTTRYTWADLASELLLLRDCLGDILNVMAYDCANINKDHYPITKKYLETYADRLTVLLKGDN